MTFLSISISSVVRCANPTNRLVETFAIKNKRNFLILKAHVCHFLNIFVDRFLGNEVFGDEHLEFVFRRR